MMYGARRIHPRRFLALLLLLLLCVVFSEISCFVYWCYSCPNPPRKTLYTEYVYEHERDTRVRGEIPSFRVSSSGLPPLFLLRSYSWIHDSHLTNRRNRIGRGCYLILTSAVDCNSGSAQGCDEKLSHDGILMSLFLRCWIIKRIIRIAKSIRS